MYSSVVLSTVLGLYNYYPHAIPKRFSFSWRTPIPTTSEASLPPASCDHRTIFCFYGFVHSGYFIGMIPRSSGSFMSGVGFFCFICFSVQGRDCCTELQCGCKDHFYMGDWGNRTQGWKLGLRHARHTHFPTKPHPSLPAERWLLGLQSWEWNSNLMHAKRSSPFEPHPLTSWLVSFTQ